MRKEIGYRTIEDSKITPTTIPQQYSGLTPQQAMLIRDEVEVGNYISIRNQNDLSEVLIYRRNNFLKDDSQALRWDGISKNLDWFKNPDDDVFIIENAEQLASLVDLVATGNDFAGKTIKLGANINLNNQEWTPIGGNYEATPVSVSGDVFYKINLTEPVFSGTFDGNGYTIYGLRMTHGNDNLQFTGLFSSLFHAIVKNLVLENVLIDSSVSGGWVSALCGYAKASSFINVIVSGEIRGDCVSSIACISVDTSFYDCVNRANLTSKANVKGEQITVGGIVGQISLSNDMISKIHQKEPILFNRCIQNGYITIYGNHAAKIWAGHMYGCLAHDPKGEEHGIIIDRCETLNDIIVHGLESEDNTKVCFFGKEKLSGYAANYVNGIGQKADLMYGLLGKTNTAINVNIIKATSSKVIDNIVLPGSINQLQSESFTNSFVTVDTSPITSEDGIANLEPYFVFIKTSKI